LFSSFYKTVKKINNFFTVFVISSLFLRGTRQPN
jgi:hypothetical protein